MTQFHEMTDAELMEIAESWLNAELRKIPAKLGLTPTQMVQVLLKCSDRFLSNYFQNIKDDEAQPER